MKRLALAGVLICVACHPGVRKANALLKRGAVLEAEKVARQEVEKRPNDADARIVLARVYMRELDPFAAQKALEPIAENPKYALRIGDAYWEAATIPSAAASFSYWAALAGGKPKQATILAGFMADAAHFNPARRAEACKAILGAAPDARDEWHALVVSAASIDSSCKRETLQMLRSWIDKSPMSDGIEWRVREIGMAAKDLDPTSTSDFAHHMRDLAERFQPENAILSRRVLEMAYETDISILNEPETVVLRDKLGVPHRTDVRSSPLLQYSEAPGTITRRAMLDIGVVISMFKTDHGRYPPAVNMTELEAALKPYLRSALPPEDGWHNPFEYTQTSDGKSARLISGGPDGHIGTPDDLIWQDGGLIEPPPQ